MKRSSNVDGLRLNAQKKRKQAFEKVEKGIQQLIQEERVINFNTVASSSGVSKAFLYKEPEIRAKIETLRLKYTGTKKLQVKQQASDASKDAMILTLKERIKRLEAENKELRRQNVVNGGQVLLVSELRQKLTACEAKNERLQREPASPTVNTLTPLKLKNIEDQLSDLDIQMNSTFVSLILKTSSEIVQKAIDSLKDAKSRGKVKNPAGFLNKAIQEAWQPNDDFDRKVELDIFTQWYPQARAKGLVLAAHQIDGMQYVVKPNGESVTFKAARLTDLCIVTPIRFYTVTSEF